MVTASSVYAPYLVVYEDKYPGTGVRERLKSVVVLPSRIIVSDGILLAVIPLLQKVNEEAGMLIPPDVYKREVSAARKARTGSVRFDIKSEKGVSYHTKEVFPLKILGAAEYDEVLRAIQKVLKEAQGIGPQKQLCISPRRLYNLADAIGAKEGIVLTHNKDINRMKVIRPYNKGNTAYGIIMPLRWGEEKK
jgi:hypothetical protein